MSFLTLRSAIHSYARTLPLNANVHIVNIGLAQTARLGCHRLADCAAECASAPSAYRAGDENRQMGQGESLARPLSHSSDKAKLLKIHTIILIWTRVGLSHGRWGLGVRSIEPPSVGVFASHISVTVQPALLIQVQSYGAL